VVNAQHRQGKALFRRVRGGADPSSVGRRHTNKGFRSRVRYRMDVALSRGPFTLIVWLGLLTLAVILASALIMTVFRLTGFNGDDGRLDPLEAFWQSLLRVLDAGTFAGDTGWTARILALIITLAGIFIAGSLIGLIANSVDQRIGELRRGRSEVLEQDHTLILGWSPRVPAIVSELTIANDSRARSAIVVLAPHDKTEMEDALRSLTKEHRSTRIVCRSGDAWSAANLEMVNLAGARSVIVVGDGPDVDSTTVKVLLAIRAHRAARGMIEGAHIVAEIASRETAKSLRALLGGGLVAVQSDDIVAELTAQACRKRGLSSVFHELLDFDGSEVYFASFPELEGRTYGECLLAFESSSIIGVLDEQGAVVLSPPPGTVLAAGQQLIGIAEDDSTFVVSAPTRPPIVGAPRGGAATRGPPRHGLAGWSALGPRVVRELDEFLDERTTIEVMVDPARVDPDEVRSSIEVSNVSVEVSELSGGPEFVAAHAARRSFHEVIVLGYRDVGEDDADAHTLLTLLAFQQVRGDETLGPVRMVAELLDQRNAPLAEVSGADDFIVSDELTSMLLAQLSERHELEQVFVDLFSPTGCSVELLPADRYAATEATCFGDVVATAATLGHSAIGYRLGATGEVVVNPSKSAPLALGADDGVVSIAPHRR
jgi:voltage-gated potassium channel Kch